MLIFRVHIYIQISVGLRLYLIVLNIIIAQIPPVAEMVPTAIRALRENPRKGSSLSAIKGFMAEEWGINIQTYAPRIKKFILKSVENGELLQTKGKGAAGRFTVPGLKARKRKSGPKRLSKKFDEDVVEYEPGKSARDEAREQTEVGSSANC